MSNIHKVPAIQQSSGGDLFVVPAADNNGMEIGEDGVGSQKKKKSEWVPPARK